MPEPPEAQIKDKYILKEVNAFLEKVLVALEADKIDISKYELDHVCYRVSSAEDYKKYQTELSKLGTLLSETEINGRNISTYKLLEPIHFQDREISVIELPSPKEDKPHPEGFEHVEFVIQEKFEDFMAQHPDIKFDLKDADKEINPDIRINYDGFTVKFHHMTVEYKIEHFEKKNI